MRHRFSCFMGNTSPTKKTRFRLWGKISEKVLSLVTMDRAEGTQEMVSTLRSFIYSTSFTGKENSSAGITSRRQPVAAIRYRSLAEASKKKGVWLPRMLVSSKGYRPVKASR